VWCIGHADRKKRLAFLEHAHPTLPWPGVCPYEPSCVPVERVEELEEGEDDERLEGQRNRGDQALPHAQPDVKALPRELADGVRRLHPHKQDTQGRVGGSGAWPLFGVRAMDPTSSGESGLMAVMRLRSPFIVTLMVGATRTGLVTVYHTLGTGCKATRAGEESV
jgi:hypothetical protein